MQGLEDLFDARNAARELEDYRKKGPAETTRWLIEALKAQGIQDRTLLDIGGGVGAVQHGLLAAGARSATDVDASGAYIAAAHQEAERRGLADRTQFRKANFITAAGEIEPADVVTLDRVLCCYPDFEQMVRRSAERARALYGVVYPRSTWWIQLGTRLLNLIFRLQKNAFRTFAHDSRQVDALLREAGLARVFHRQGLIWQVVVYRRAQDSSQSSG